MNAGHQQANGTALSWCLANKLTPKLKAITSAPMPIGPSFPRPISAWPQTQSAFTGFGRANLNWRVTPKDFLQFNVFVNGKTLLPQGYVAPFVSGNIGYRHTVNSKVSWMFVVQDHVQHRRRPRFSVLERLRRPFQTRQLHFRQQ